MVKKDNIWENPYGGIFDFNGDGKEDFCEQYFGHELYEEAERAEEEIDESSDDTE